MNSTLGTYPVRLNILKTVDSEGGCTRPRLSSVLPVTMTKQGWHNHLNILRKAGMLDMKRDGRQTIFVITAKGKEAMEEGL